MSLNDDNPKDVEKAKKKYLWFGYGGYSNFAGFGPVNPGNIRADPHIFDKLFEVFGVKEKPKKDTGEDRS